METEPLPFPSSEILTEPLPFSSSEILTKPLPSSSSEMETEPLPSPSSEMETQPLQSPSSEMETEPLPSPSSEMKTEPLTFPLSEIKTEPLLAPSSEMETKPLPFPSSEILTEPQPSPSSEMETEPLPILSLEIKTEPLLSPSSEMETKPLPFPSSELLTEPQPSPSSEMETEPLPILSLEIKTEPLLSPSSEMETKPLPFPSSELLTEPQPSPSSEMETEPLPILSLEIKTEPLPSPSSEMETKPPVSPSSGKKPSRLTSCVVFWPYVLTLYTMSIMTMYLTGVWNLSITQAAAIVNLYSGIGAIMPAITARIADCHRGSYSMLWLSRFAFICGFGLLTMSTPPVLAVVTGSCSSFVPQCIGRVHKILFYIALLLLAIGQSTHLSSWPQFNDDQFNTEVVYTSKTENVYKRSCQLFSLAILMLVVPVCAVIAVGLSKSWLIKFGIGAISTVVSTLIFSSGLYSYKRPNGDSSRLTGFFTIISRGGIFAVMLFIASCMTLVLSGVISSIGNTFFIEQATDMNHYVGRLKVPVLILPALQLLVKLILKIPSREARVRFAFPGIILSFMSSVLCCITAAKVESRRLDTVKSHGFIDKPKETIPMTMFWLLPQFLLLGLAQEMGKQSIVYLYYAPLWFAFRNRSFCIYTETLADAVSGVGNIGGMLSVYAVGKMKPSWFQYTLNRSRLDNYYWTLAALSAANLASFFLLILLPLLLPRF